MPISDDTRAALQSAAGNDRQRGPRMDLRTITFDGKKGELRMTEKDGTIVPIAMPAEFVVLKKRNALKAFTDASYFSTEYDYASSIINLFKRENGRTVHVDQGTPKQLRAMHPFLKWMQPCYVLYKGEVMKLDIKGASASAFIDYSKKLQSENLHSYMVMTVVPSAGTGKKGAINYRFMQFESRDLTEDEAVQTTEALKKLTSDLFEIDKFYAEKNARKADIAPEPQAKDAADIDYPDEEINPEDIPF